jgi:hypothetical protein
VRVSKYEIYLRVVCVAFLYKIIQISRKMRVDVVVGLVLLKLRIYLLDCIMFVCL